MKSIAAFIGFILLLARIAAAASETSVYASSAGARLNTDLLDGGGTDDTSVLQRLLDKAVNAQRVHVIIDGPALVSGLNVYGNTTVECTAGGGLYLKDNSSRAIIRNVHRSRGVITDEHITVRGCFLNGNRKHQGVPLSNPTFPGQMSQHEPDGTPISGVQFLGVNHLAIENVTIWNTSCFGGLVGNGSQIDIRNVNVDDGGGPNPAWMEYSGADGLHFKGPLRYLFIDNVRIRAGDDAIALNADDEELHDFGPYWGQGPITDVSINNVQFRDPLSGIRLLSGKERIDRVIINNITGTIIDGYVANISHWIDRSLGNFGSIIFNNVNVSRSTRDSGKAAKTEELFRQMARQGGSERAVAIDYNGGPNPYFSINAHIEDLSLRNVMTKVADDRPIIRIGPDADVQMLTAELSLYDPELQGRPVKLDEGGRVEHMNLALD